MFTKIFKFAPRNRITEDSYIKEEILTYKETHSQQSYQSVPKQVGSFPVKGSSEVQQQQQQQQQQQLQQIDNTKIGETVYNSILSTMNAYPSYEDIM
jgi:hypothetical protein